MERLEVKSKHEAYVCVKSAWCNEYIMCKLDDTEKTDGVCGLDTGLSMGGFFFLSLSLSFFLSLFFFFFVLIFIILML